jgi:serine/threonine protein kinase
MICDFGLARIFLEEGSTGLTTTSEHTGTTRYLAPELVASDTTVYPNQASDVYALGCLGLDVSIEKIGLCLPGLLTPTISSFIFSSHSRITPIT